MQPILRLTWMYVRVYILGIKLYVSLASNIYSHNIRLCFYELQALYIIFEVSRIDYSKQGMYIAAST